jgi:cell pole-organizing protein PopZ
MPAHRTSRAARPAVEQEDASILSVESEVAARHSLSALSSMLVTPKDGEDNTLDGLVRSMLKPMLKEWLDSRLPTMVEDMVAKEIARITGR